MSREEAAQKNQEGLRLCQLEKYDEAIRLFDEAIEIDVEYATPWLNRSESNRKLGREAEADADKEKWRTILGKQKERDAKELSLLNKEQVKTTGFVVKIREMAQGIAKLLRKLRGK